MLQSRSVLGVIDDFSFSLLPTLLPAFTAPFSHFY